MKPRNAKMIEEALLRTKPRGVKRLRLIAVEMKNILKELKAAENRPHLKKADRYRLCGRAWELRSALQDYEVRCRPTFLSKVPQSTLKLFRALPKAVAGTYREVYSK